MHTELRHFLAQLAGVVATTLLPVIAVTFLSLPLNLDRHPGDLAQHDASQPMKHMS